MKPAHRCPPAPLGWRRRAAARNVVLLSVACLLLVAAGLLYSWLNSPEGAPTDQFVAFRCTKCEHKFVVSHREFERRWDKHEFRGGGSGQPLRFRCDKCGEFTAERDETPPGADEGAPTGDGAAPTGDGAPPQQP